MTKHKARKRKRSSNSSMEGKQQNQNVTTENASQPSIQDTGKAMDVSYTGPQSVQSAHVGSQSAALAPVTPGAEKASIEVLCKSVAALHTKLDGLTSKLDTIRDGLHGVNGLESRAAMLEDEVSGLGDRLNIGTKNIAELGLLKDVVVRQGRVISFLLSEVQDLEARSMRNGLLFYSVPEKVKEIDPIETVYEALSEGLTLESPRDGITVERAHGMGAPMASEARHSGPLIAVFHSSRRLERVLAAARRLPYGSTGLRVVRRYPEGTREKRRLCSQLIDDLKKSDRNVQTKVVAGDLFINKARYRLAVQRPSVVDIFSMDEDELAVANDMRTTEPYTVTEGGVTVRAIAGQVQSTNHVRTCYKKTLREYAGSALHCAVAYSVRDTGEVVNYGCYDDGEHGAGRLLLQAIKDSGKNNIAVFLQKNWGSSKGNRPFKAIKQAAESAVQACIA